MLFYLLSFVSGAQIFAPYVDVTGNFDFSTTAAVGVKMYSMAFANTVCSTSKLVIGQDIAFEEKKSLVDTIRATGGDVILSFGGAWQDAAKDPAACGYDAQKVQSIYQKFVDTYQLNYIDLDIEGAALDDRASVDVRSTALAGLKKANPNLVISLTIPVAPSGLLDNALNALKSAINAGLEYDVVNIMAMDYGASVTAMGEAAVSASKGTIAQLRSLKMTNTKLGITPMIGKNDGDSGTFTVDDAKTLMAFANGNNDVGLLSFWVITADPNCEYSKILLGSGNAQLPSTGTRIRRPPVNSTDSIPTTNTPISTSQKIAVNSLSMNVCGGSWIDAVQTCAQACPNGVDRECPNGQKCYNIESSSCPGVAPNNPSSLSSGAKTMNSCGSSWIDAASSCSKPCPSGLDGECGTGRCYDITGSPTCLGIPI